PTHGAGSFCTAAPGSARSTTIGLERRTNPLLGLGSEDAFAEALLGSMPSYPTYFHAMRALNRRGPRVLGRLPELEPLSPLGVRAGLPVRRIAVLTIGDLRSRLGQDDQLVVLDVRQDAEWAAGHIPGARHVEAGVLATTELGEPRDRVIATHCGHEARSATAL